METLAVLMTCHNRKKTTLKCLKSLFEQKDISGLNVAVYLVDDGSTDGTSKAVAEQYPSINILQGDGELFWTGGMRKAMNAAIKKGYDFYLWLNDDTILYPDALEALFKNYVKVKSKETNEPIISGNLWDPIRDKISYGGYRNESSWHPLRFTQMKPKGAPAQCDVINGNVVLLSAEVVDNVGNLHPKLKHAAGDYEYALRARKLGYTSWITAEYVGECPRNINKDTWKDSSLSLLERYKKIFNDKGEPLYPRMIYYSEYGGKFWPIFFLGVYVRPLLDIFHTK